jgi:predicted Zn-dependent protease
MGSLAQAEETLSRAVSLAGEDMVVIDHYAQVLEASGKLSKAVALMKAALDTKLSEQSANDADTKDALERMRKRLKAILQRNPELERVEKTALIKKAPPQEGQTSLDLDREFNKYVLP